MTASRAKALRSTAKTFLLGAAAPTALLMAMASPVAAQSTNSGVITSTAVPLGGTSPSVTGATAPGGTTTITLGSARTVLNWGDATTPGFNLANGDRLNFVFASNTDIALNRVNNGATTISGQLFGCLGACPTIGGNIWFVSNGGVIVNSTAVINTGGLLLSTGAITDANFFSGGTFNFTAAPDGSSVLVFHGASITTANGNITLQAPRVSTPGGTFSSPQGSIALIGAKDVSIAFDADLNAYTAITINEGSNEGTAVVVGTNAAFSAAPVASGGVTYMIAAGNGAGMGQLVVSGSGAANAVTISSGDVVLYAAGNTGASSSGPTTPISVVSGGAVQALTPSATGNVNIGAMTASAGSIDVRASAGLLSGRLESANNTRLEAGSNVNLSERSVVGGNYFVRADDFFGEALNPDFGAGTTNNFTIESIGAISTGARHAPGTLTIKAEGGDLNVTGALTSGTGDINLTTTGGLPGIGQNININSTVTDTGADDTVTLTASGSVTQNASGLITAGTLTANATAGAVDLDNAANTVTTLGASGGATGFAYSDTTGLVVNNTVSGGTGDVSIATGAGGLLNLTGAQITTSGGGNIVLAGGGGISLGNTTIDSNVGSALPSTADGDVTLTGGVSVAGNNFVEGDNIAFSSSVGLGAGMLDLRSASGTTFNGDVNLQALSVTGLTRLNTGSITTSGNLSLGDVVVTTPNPVSLQAFGTGSLLAVGNITDADTTPNVLMLSANGAGGRIRASDIGTASAKFASITFTSPTTELSSDIFSSEAVSFSGALVLNAGDHSITGSSVTFNGAVDAALASDTVTLLVTGAGTDGADPNNGDVRFNAPVGGSVPLDGLAVVATDEVVFTGTNNVGTFAASVGAGGVNFDSGSALTIGTVQGVSGVNTSTSTLPSNIDITTTGGGLTLLQAVNAGAGDVILTSAAAITGNALVTGDDVTLDSTSGVGTGTSGRVNTSATRLAANGGSAGVFVNETDAVTLQSLGAVNNTGTIYDLVAGGQIDVAGSVAATIGNVNLQATVGDINLATTGSISSPAEARLTAAATLHADPGATITANDIFLTAQNFTGLITDNAVLQETDDVTIVDTAGGGSFTNVGAASDLSITSNAAGGTLTVNGAIAGDSISLTSAGDLQLDGAIDATGSPVLLSATAGLINQASGTITSGSLTATALNGISLTGANLIGTFTNLTNTGAGNISARSNVAGGVQIGTVSAADGNVTLASTTGLRLTGGTTGISVPSGDILLDGPVIVSGNYAIAASGGAGEGDITFNGTVNGNTAGADNLTVTASGATTFNGDVGLTTLLGSLVVNGPATLNAQNLRAANGITTGDLTLGMAGPVDVIANGGGGAGALQTGNIIAGVAGIDLALEGSSITVSNVGTPGTALNSVTFNDPTNLGGNVTAVANVDFIDTLTLGAGAHTITAGAANFGGAVDSVTADGTAGLTVTAPVATFAASVGATRALSSLTVNGGTNIDGAATTIRTTGGQTYNGATSLLSGGTTDFVSTTSGNIAFNGQLNGADAVTVSTGGLTTFGGLVGNATALTSLATDTGGSTTVTGGVRTTGAQDFNDAVTLAANSVFESTGGAAITFDSTVDGAFGLDARTTGATTFTGAVGAGTALAFVTTNAGGTTEINGGSITTTGDQTYGDTVELGAATTTLTGDDGSFFAVDGNGNDLILNFSGTVAIGPNFTNIDDLSSGNGGTTNLSGTITTTGMQTYSDAVVLTGATTVASTGAAAAGNITFANTVNGGFDLAVNTAGTGTFDGVVGGGTALASLTTDATGTTRINTSAITTTGAQTYGDAVVLGAGLHTLTGGSASFQAVNGTTANTSSLLVDVVGAATFNSPVGAAAALTGLGVDAAAAAFTGTNFVGTLAANVAGGLTFTNGQTLTVGTVGSLTGVTTANTPINLTTTGAGSNLQLDAAVNAGTGAVDLNSAGTINQNASGVITAGTLNSDSVGATTLTAATNQITSLAASSANGFFLNDGGGLTVTGPVNGAAGGVGLTTSGTLAVNGNVTATNGPIGLTATGAGSDVTLTSTVNAGAGTVTLTAADAVQQTAGAIIAGNLTGSSGGTTDLGAVAANNDVATLGAFSAGSGFSYRDVNGFNVTGAVNSGTGDLTLIAETGNMGLGANLTSAQTVNLNASTGSITQTAGAVTAATLTGFSSLATTLGGANQITNLGTFAANGLTLNDLGGLTVTGTVSGGADGVSITTSNGNLTVAGTGSVTVNAAPGGLSLTTTGSGDIVLNGGVTNAGRTVTLNSAGAVTQNAAGVVTAGTLTGSSAGATTLTAAANQITNLGPYAANGFSLLDVGGLTVTGAVGGGAGGVSLETSGDLAVNAGVSATNAAIALTATGAGSDIALAAPVNAGTGTVTLTAGAGIGQTAAGVVTGGTLTGSSVGATTLTAATNQLTNLGAFAANGFSLLDAGGLTVTGAVSGGAGGVSLNTSGDLAVNAAISATNSAIGLTTTGAGSDIALNAAVNAGTGTVTLTSAATITQSAAGITAGTLTGSAVSSATLEGANQLTNLGAFTADGFRLIDAGGLTVTGAVAGGAGGVRVETSGDLAVNAGVSATNAAVTLVATGAGSDIALAAPVNAGTGTVTLTAAGTIGQTAAGVVTGGTLTGSSGGATTLTAARNQLTNLGAFTANGFSLLDGGGLTVTGAVAGGAGGVSVETSGDLTVNAAVSATNAPVTLTATGAGSDIALNAGVNAGSGVVTLTANGTGGTIGQNASGAIVAGTLTGSSDGATTLTAASNNVANLGAFSANGFSLADTAGGLNIVGAVNARAGSAIISTVGDLVTTATGSVLADTDIGLTATGLLIARDLAAIDIALSAGGNVTAGTLTARDDVAIRAGGSVTTGAITSGATLPAGGPVDRTGLADALAGALPGHDIDISGQGVTTGQLRANGAGSDVRVSGGANGFGSATTDVSVTASGNINLTGTTRGIDVALSSGGTISTGAVTARDDIVMRAAGAVTTGALSAGATVNGQAAVDQAGSGDTLAAADPLRGPGAAAFTHTGGGDVSVKSGGDVTLAAASAQRDILVDTTGVAAFDGAVTATAGGLLTIARDVRLGAAVNVGEDVVFYARSGQVTVGGAAADATDRFNLTSAELNLITADSVNVFGGTPDGGSAPITVGNLTLSATRLPTLRVYTTGDVTVSGTITGDAGSAFVAGASETQYTSPTPASAADRPVFDVAGRSWELRTGWTPGTIRVTGVLGGPATTTGGTLGADSSWLGLVSLAANSVLIFPAQDDALLSVGGFEEATHGPNGQDPARLFAYKGTVQHQIVSDTVAIRASDEVLQRNLDTAVPNSAAGRGMVAGRLLVDALTPGGATPTRLSLFGQLAADLNGLRSGVTLVDGPGAATLVRDQSGGASASIRFNAPPGTYRFNGCEIGTGGGCLTVRVDPTLPPIDAISSIGNLLDRFATIEDEPVTSTGIELFWFARDDDQADDEDDEEEEKK